MRCLVEHLVMVDPEYGRGRRRRDSADCWREKARSDVRKHDQAREAVKIRNATANGKARNLGIVPFDGKENGTGTEHVEIISVVRVFPDVIAAEDEILAEGLLQTGVEFIAKAGDQRCESRPKVTGEALCDGHDRVDYRITASRA